MVWYKTDYSTSIEPRLNPTSRSSPNDRIIEKRVFTHDQRPPSRHIQIHNRVSRLPLLEVKSSFTYRKSLATLYWG